MRPADRLVHTLKTQALYFPRVSEQSFIMSPVELVKVRLQLAEGAALSAVGAGASGSGGGAFALASGVVRSFGLSGLLSKGLGATMGRDVLPHGVWFATYEWCKQGFSRREGVKTLDNGTLNVGAQLASGGIAATAAWLVGESSSLRSPRISSAPPIFLSKMSHNRLFLSQAVLGHM